MGVPIKLLVQFAAGPAAFLFVYGLPFQGLTPEARLVAGVFGWMILWWMTSPVPWAITSLLPLILFPILDVMDINQAVGMYGQTIFFWIWGTVLMGYALDRHGVARRFALWIMGLRVVGGNSTRLAFAFMAVCATISTVVSDAATVAMMMPVGLSLIRFSQGLGKDEKARRSNFGAFLALGALYGAVAGGCATIAGAPHNKLSVDILQRITGRTLGWFEWMQVGVPIFLVSLVVFFVILRIVYPPEFQEIRGGAEFVRQEKLKMGNLARGERAVLFVFGMMVVMFLAPSLLELTLGSTHSVTRWTARALSLNVVPPAVMLLLFCTPVSLQGAKREFVLDWRDAIANTPWDAMMLCASATGLVGVLVEFGLSESLGNVVGNLGLSANSLPYVSAAALGFGTNFMSGVAATALFAGILIPAALEIGWNPASMAVLLPNVAIGIIMPWAGATSATAFAFGTIELWDMIKTGAIATGVFAVLVTTIHILLAPFL
jgi:sodium-dependent dicarboxylate transporter 2/3/5